MSVYDGLPEFIMTRLDLEEEFYITARRMVKLHRDNALREIAAKRRIVQRCWRGMNELDPNANGLVTERALLARQVLMDLGHIWADAKGYNPDWKPPEGSWHVGATLSDGRHAYASHDDPIVLVMRRINRALQMGRPRSDKDDAEVAAWLYAHAEQVSRCLAGSCGHTT